MTIKEIESTMVLHHTATRSGYVSRKSEGVVIEYSGIYGEGYIIIRPRWDSTRFVTYEYYIK